MNAIFYFERRLKMFGPKYRAFARVDEDGSLQCTYDPREATLFDTRDSKAVHEMFYQMGVRNLKMRLATSDRLSQFWMKYQRHKPVYDEMERWAEAMQ